MVHVPTSIKQCYRIAAKKFGKFEEMYAIKDNLFVCDVTGQIIEVLKYNWDLFLSYRQTLQEGLHNDVLSCPKYNMKVRSTDPYYVNLLLCSDGAQFTKKNESFRPIQLIILDLPLSVRNKMHNRILLSLSQGKPNHENIYQLLNNQLLGTYKLKNQDIIFTVHSAIFDLPGLASACNMTQYNGKYGCPFCLHPGQTVESGKGMSRVYKPNQTFEIRSVDSHHNHMQLATRQKRPFFGVKGFCSLSNLIELPTMIALDTMHCVYEGVTKHIITYCFSPKYRHFPFYLNRPATRAYVNNFISNINVPHDFSKFRMLGSENIGLTASEYKNILLYLLFPIFFHWMHFNELQASSLGCRSRI